VVAPFSPNYSVAVGRVARAVFERTVELQCPEVNSFSDMMTLSRYQYVSTFSRGSREPGVIFLDAEL
jgi:hypothetical protein